MYVVKLKLVGWGGGVATRAWLSFTVMINRVFFTSRLGARASTTTFVFCFSAPDPEVKSGTSGGP